MPISNIKKFAAENAATAASEAKGVRDRNGDMVNSALEMQDQIRAVM